MIELPPIGWGTSAELRRALSASGAMTGSWLEKSDRYGWMISARILLPFFGLIGSMPLWALASAWICVPMGLLLGLYGYKISFVMHDCAHDTLFRTRILNLRMGIVCGWLVGADFLEYKRVHLDHHRFNGTERDPQWSETGGGLHGATRWRIIWHLFNALAGQRVLSYLAGYHTGRSAQLAPASKVRFPNWAGIVLAQAAIAVVASNFGRLPWLVLVYPVSAGTIALLLARLRTFAEHIRPDGVSIFDFTRSHRPNWIDAFLLYDAHFNYHLEHHIFPHIPSGRLPQFHADYAKLIHTQLTLMPSMIGTIWRRVREARP